MLYYLKQLPVQLVLSITAAFLLGSLLDVTFISAFYTISSCLIEVLIFILPVMVFGFIFRALVSTQKNSLSLILFIFAGVTLSNLLALTIAYLFGQTFLPFFGLDHSPDFVTAFSSEVSLLYRLDFPVLIGTEKAMLIGVILGVSISLLNEHSYWKRVSRSLSGKLNQWISWFLQKVFLPLLPFYVFGFCLKLSYDQALVHLFQQFGKVFILSMGLVVVYLCFLYLVGAAGNAKKAIENLKNMLPAGLTGFSTMSSAVTMPVTLSCTKTNTQDEELTNLIIPSTANIHMLGDDLTLVMTSMTLLSVFGMPWPNFAAFIPFAFAFSMAKLSCVGVPGASVLVILPVLQSHLGFSPEMVSVLTTIYILQDSFGTAANVMGNGAFALIIQRLLGWIKTQLAPLNHA